MSGCVGDLLVHGAHPVRHPDGRLMGRAKRQSCRFVRVARFLAYLLDMSRSLRSVRLYDPVGIASHPAH